MEARVTFQDLAARHARNAERVEGAVLGVLRSGRYVGGPVVAELEAAIAGTMGRAYGVGVSCGTEALVLALQVVGVRPGDEVIIPALSFFATAGAVIHSGAVPVVVDVLADRPLLDPLLAERAVTSRTRAIVPVHLFGDLCPIPASDLPIVEDAAQAIGVPTSGACATLSFYPTKVLGGAGEGGMVLTDDPDHAEALRLLRNHGMERPHEPILVGGVVGKNARLDALQAAVLLAHLPDLPAEIQRRQAVARRYDEAFGSLVIPRDPRSPIASYVIRHPRRDELRRLLAERGIESQVYYPKPLSALPGVSPATTPEATRFTRECLALPCHGELSDPQVGRVVDGVLALG
jgi:dTDP-4-amino-4,6-dideoxygalactose transaminase